MREATQFLEYVGVLLGESTPHPTSDLGDLIVTARAALETLRLAEPSSDFILTPSGVNWGSRPLDVGGAAWLDRLRQEGIAVLAPPNDEAGFGRWIAGLAAQVGSETDARTLELVGATAAGSTQAVLLDAAPESVSENTPPAAPPSEPADAIEAPTDVGAPDSERMLASVFTEGLRPDRSLQSEADRVLQLHEAASQGYSLSYPEASGIVSNLLARIDDESLSAEADIISTLDEYTTVHSLNTALLSMKLAQRLGYETEVVVEVGVAGLLHDIGKVRLGDLPSVSREMLSGDERGVLQSHSAEGAALLLDSGVEFGAAAVVAYEHHMPWEGESGYPTRHFDRDTHVFSRIVAICDVYDVLRSERSFRPALTRPAVLKYLALLGKRSLDPTIVGTFVELARSPLPRIAVPTTRPEAETNEIGWLPETGYDADCEPRPVRF